MENKKRKEEDIPKPKTDIKVEKPAFKSTLANMIKKKPPQPPNGSK